MPLFNRKTASEIEKQNSSLQNHLENLVEYFEARIIYNIDRWNEMKKLIKLQYNVIKKKQNKLCKEVMNLKSDILRIKGNYKNHWWY